MKDTASAKKLGDVVVVQSGFAFKSSEYSESGHFLIRIANVQDGHLSLEKPKYVTLDAKTKRFELCAGDILTSLTGNVGRVAKIEPEHLPAALNQRVARLVPKPDAGIDPQYLLRFLHSSCFSGFLEERAHGAAQANVSPSVIGEVPIPLPPLEEQRRIVAVLDEAFEGLARARAHTEANLQNARELFDWQLSAIFKEIGSGQRKPLGDVCEFVRGPFGGSLKKSIFKPSGYAVYEQQHAIRDQFDDFRYFINDAKFAEMMRFRVEAGDLIMSCSGTMGKVAIVPEGAPDGIINQALLKLRPSNNLRADFLKRWMQSDDFQDQLSANTMGVAIKNVASVKTLKTLSAVVPSLEEQDNTVRKSEEAEQQFIVITRNCEAKLQDLDDLRQSLLQKAFAGELT